MGMVPKRILIFKNLIEGLEPPQDTENGKPVGKDEHLEGECDVLVTKGRETSKRQEELNRLNCSEFQ